MKSIRAKILVSVLAVMILSTGVIGYFSSYYSKAALEQEIERNTIQLSEGYAADLGSKLNFYTRLMQTTALSLFNAISIENVLIDQRRAYPELRQFFYTNLSGGIIDYHPRNREHLSFNFSGQPYWKQVKLNWEKWAGQWDALVSAYGETAQTRIVTDSLTISDITDAFGPPAIVISAPVPVYYGGVFAAPEIQGIISVVLPLGDLFRSLSGIKVGETGAILVTDRRGRILVHPDAALVLQTDLSGISGDVSLNHIESAMGEGSTGIGSYERDGREYFLAFAPVPGISWSLGVFGALDEFTRGVNQLLMVNLGILLVSIFVAASVIILLIKTLIRPIRHLTDVIGHIRNGDLDVRAEVNSSDEIGQFAQTFNIMTEELWRYRNHLEELVKEQTKQLEETNAELRQEVKERGQAEAVARKAKAAADAANQAKSTFLANMSHELRTPLNAILGFSELMEENPRIPAEERQNLNTIRKSGSHLLTLINQVLDLSKIEAGQMTMNPESVDLKSLVDDIGNMFLLKTREKGVALRTDVGPDVPRIIRTDRMKLRQVLINLLSNAVKFTENGEIRLRFSVGENAGGAEIQVFFEVSDTGPGISSEETDRLFEAFAQTETGKSAHEGTGLGLAISRRFVQLMGGDISVDSEVGKGSVFRFHIRAERGEGPGKGIHGQAEKRMASMEPGYPGFRVLIVDDQPENRMLLMKILGPPGFMLREAVNGSDAVAVWKKWRPHLIWMDIRMPEMDGYEATRMIKDADKENKTKIIAVTASVFEEEKSNVLEAGCDGFLRKPYCKDDVLEMTRQHLGIQYFYKGHRADEPEKKMETRPSPADAFSGAEDLSKIPVELLKSMARGCETADMGKIDELIGRIGSYTPVLAESLRKLADDFEYEEILLLIRRAVKKV